MQNHLPLKRKQKRFGTAVDQKAEGLSSSVYSEDSLKKVDDAVKVLKEIVASTSKDKGAEKLSALYDKTNNADNAKDPLNYYGYAQGEFALNLVIRQRRHFVQASQVC